MQTFFILSFLTSILAFLFALYLYLWVKRQKVVNGEIDRISHLIKKGADTFIAREYRLLGMFAGVVALLILVLFPSPLWRPIWRERPCPHWPARSAYSWPRSPTAGVPRAPRRVSRTPSWSASGEERSWDSWSWAAACSASRPC